MSSLARFFVASSAFVVTVTLTLAATSAIAMDIDPQCAKMTSKIACTCALQNGGSIGTNASGKPVWRKGGRRGSVYSSFDKCVQDNGG
jgi:hypothetical protein